MDSLQKELEALQAANRILEEENAQLSERAEDAMLLAQVAEALEGVTEPKPVIDNVLERISILKNLPFVTCGRLCDGQVERIGSYAAFSDESNVGYPITLSEDICVDLRFGPYIDDSGEGLTTGFTDVEFDPQAVLLVPFICHEFGSGVFLFFDLFAGRQRLSDMVFLLEQVVRLTASRLDNLFLSRELELLNKQLEERVQKKTRDLRTAHARLQKTHERFVAILDGVDAYINVVDTTNYTVLFGNKAAKNFFGADIEGRKCYQILRGDNQPCSFCKIPQLLADGGEQGRFITWESFNPLTGRYFLNSERLVYWGDVPNALLSIGTDITAVKQAEEEKQLLAERLHQAQKMEAIGMLAGSVAHDLNNILSGVVSYPDLLLATMQLEPPMRKALETIRAAGKKGANIVQDLLTLARRGVQVEELVDLGQLISDYLDSPEFFEMQKHHAGVTLVGPAAASRLLVKGSPAHLSNVVMNLVNNAAEAIPGVGEIRIDLDEVVLTEQPAGMQAWHPGRYARISVRDTGTGIEQEYVDKIFDPFFTLHKEGRSGTGLGLAVVWRTIVDHHGFVEVESVVGEGTVFRIYLPLAEAGSGAKADLTQQQLRKGCGQTVLVVDDDEDQRRIATEILIYLDYIVQTAESGEKAISMLRAAPVDLVLLDMLMPSGMDGLATYRHIREFNPAQKTVIVSGFSQSERVKDALELGVCGYLQKPYSLTGISETVAEVLEG